MMDTEEYIKNTWKRNTFDILGLDRLYNIFSDFDIDMTWLKIGGLVEESESVLSIIFDEDLKYKDYIRNSFNVITKTLEDNFGKNCFNKSYNETLSSPSFKTVFVYKNKTEKVKEMKQWLDCYRDVVKDLYNSHTYLITSELVKTLSLIKEIENRNVPIHDIIIKELQNNVDKAINKINESYKIKLDLEDISSIDKLPILKTSFDKLNDIK